MLKNSRAGLCPSCVLDQYTDPLGSIQQLDNVDVQKLEALTRWHKDTGDTVKWLRQNRHRFKMEIFEPPMLSISVPDKRFVNAIEACFSANDLQVGVQSFPSVLYSSIMSPDFRRTMQRGL